jgi:hypothetical protein
MQGRHNVGGLHPERRCMARAGQNLDLCVQGRATQGWWQDIDEDGWEAPRLPKRKPRLR